MGWLTSAVFLFCVRRLQYFFLFAYGVYNIFLFEHGVYNMFIFCIYNIIIIIYVYSAVIIFFNTALLKNAVYKAVLLNPIRKSAKTSIRIYTLPHFPAPCICSRLVNAHILGGTPPAPLPPRLYARMA